MLLYNGRLLPEPGFTLPLPNRGLFYNDGFFETLIWADGSIRYLAHHLARMHRAAAVLGLELPDSLLNGNGLTNLLRPLVEAHALGQARLRVQIWRGGGGLYTPETAKAEFVATLRPYLPNEAPVERAGFSEQVRTLASPLAFCKGPHVLLYVQAGRERASRGLDELILLDARGYVAEAVAAAVFWLRGGQLFTPALGTGCVAGVRRAHVLEVAQARGLICNEGYYKKTDLLAAEAIFTANVAALRPVLQLDDVSMPAQHPLYQLLRTWEAA